MARITDPAKLDSIKKATISLIVEKGYGGSSISAIAAKAGVADGYLYRHYQSKSELVRDLFNESAKVFTDILRRELDAYASFKEFVTRYNQDLVSIINEMPDNAKFFIQLVNDFTFDINGSAVKEDILALCERLLTMSSANNELPENCSLVDIYTIVIIIPLQVFSLYLKGFFGDVELNSENAVSVTETCLKIVRK